MKRVILISLRLPLFLLRYAREVVLANIRVAKDVLRIRPKINPGFFEFETTLKTDVEVFLLSNLITMTPGTLTVDVDRPKKKMIIHSLYLFDPKAETEAIRATLEKWVRELLR